MVSIPITTISSIMHPEAPTPSGRAIIGMMSFSVYAGAILKESKTSRIDKFLN